MNIPECVQRVIDVYPVCGEAIRAAYEIGVADGRIEQIQKRAAECDARMERIKRDKDNDAR